jgi:hypothetical protein
MWLELLDAWLTRGGQGLADQRMEEPRPRSVHYEPESGRSADAEGDLQSEGEKEHDQIVHVCL